MKKWLRRGMVAIALATGLVAGDLGRSRSVHGAEYLQVGLGLFSIRVPIEELKTFANTGEAGDSLSVYLSYLSPEAKARLREVLTRRFEVSPVAVSQVTYASIGEDFLARLGNFIETPTGNNAAQAIRASLILSAAQPEGMSVIEILDTFPTEGIHVDAGRLLNLQREVSSYFSYRDAALEAIRAESEAAVETSGGQVNWDTLPDLRRRGSVDVNETTLRLRNQFPGLAEMSPRMFDVDLYVPQTDQTDIPVVVISHGLGSNRDQFAEMARHLASYGFVVAVPEHPGSDTDYQQEFLANLAYEGINPLEFVYRPWDVKTVISALAAEPAYNQQFDLDHVGVIGHSFGGYTALALAGAPLNQARLQARCNPVEYVLNLSTLLQCRAANLPLSNYDLADERVGAVMAYSPVTSVLLGPESMAQIQKPVMMVTGSSDFIAPSVPEQIHPFVWLETPQKHLAAMIPASHVSINGEVDFADQVDVAPQVSSLLTGPDPELSSRYAQALNVAFMGFYLSDRPGYQTFLGAAYAAEFLSEEPVKFRIIDKLTPEQLTETYGGQPPLPIYPPKLPPAQNASR